MSKEAWDVSAVLGGHALHAHDSLYTPHQVACPLQPPPSGVSFLISSLSLSRPSHFSQNPCTRGRVRFERMLTPASALPA